MIKHVILWQIKDEFSAEEKFKIAETKSMKQNFFEEVNLKNVID